MTMLEIIVAILTVGVLLWVINTFVPMEGHVRNLLTGFVIVLLVVWMLKVLGAWPLLERAIS